MGWIIFDLDGTLADSKLCIRESVAYAFDRMGLGELRYCHVSVTQKDLASTFRATMEDHARPYDEQMIREFIDHYRYFHQHEAESKIRLFEGVIESLESLRSGIKMGVATTKHSVEARRVMKRLEIDHYFDHIQGTDPGLRYKPAPDIILKSMEVLSAPTEQCVYVGDAVHDMQAARSAGIKGVGAAYGFAGDEALKEFKPDFLVYDPRDLGLLPEKIFSS